MADLKTLFVVIADSPDVASGFEPGKASFRGFAQAAAKQITANRTFTKCLPKAFSIDRLRPPFFWMRHGSIEKSDEDLRVASCRLSIALDLRTTFNLPGAISFYGSCCFACHHPNDDNFNRC